MRRSPASPKQRVNSLIPLVPSLAGERVAEHLLGEAKMGNPFGKADLPAEEPAQLQPGKVFVLAFHFA